MKLSPYTNSQDEIMYLLLLKLHILPSKKAKYYQTDKKQEFWEFEYPNCLVYFAGKAFVCCPTAISALSDFRKMSARVKARFLPERKTDASITIVSPSFAAAKYLET